jgi:hypothetical protein
VAVQGLADLGEEFGGDDLAGLADGASAPEDAGTDWQRLVCGLVIVGILLPVELLLLRGSLASASGHVKTQRRGRGERQARFYRSVKLGVKSETGYETASRQRNGESAS